MQAGVGPVAPQPGAGAPAAGPDPAVADAHAMGSMSLFALPASRGARLARVLAILALDAVLAGAGIAMIVSYVNARGRAHSQPARTVDAGMAEVEVLSPTTVAAQPNAGPRAQPRTPPAAARTVATASADATAGRTAAAIPEPAPTAPAAASDAAASAPSPSGHDIDDFTRRVTAVVERNAAQLQRCHQQAARHTAAPLEGRVDIHLELTPSGHARDVYPVTNPSHSDKLARCVAGLFESWTFPEPPGDRPLELVWPLRFKAPKQ